MTPNEQTSSNIVNGRPSKELFITMLTRDISLIDAISDLVDNCVDGAIKLKGGRKFTGLGVDITLNDNCFKIKDNCSGIDKDLAQKYAFRFGRPSDAKAVDYSVGQFGIGMKRALFKMGNKFEINSVSQNSSFSIEIDVDKWSKEENWDFRFKKIKDNKFLLKDCGTEIIVTSLRPDVKERFKSSNFIGELKEKLELQHLMNSARGLKIKINSNLIESAQLKLLDGAKFKTAFWGKNFTQYGNTKVKIYAGLGIPDQDKGGWYIFCNNRLIEGPEQTGLTGWGNRTAIKIPKYHNQFSRFRGYVFFESKSPSFLPWNTSKTTVDADSPMFQSIRLELVSLMRPIIDFLNDLHDEGTDYFNKKLEEKYLQKQVDAANLKDFLKVTIAAQFSAPTQKSLAKENDEVTIKFARGKDEVDQLKKFFQVSSPKDVGEKAFDYVYERECK
jgi:hypothetical protein